MLVDKDTSQILHKADRQVYEIVEPLRHHPKASENFHNDTFDALESADKQIYQLIKSEYDRQQNTLQLIAAENQCSQAVLAALGSVVQNKTTEGFVGARFHGGCQVVDALEQLAIDRAKEAFKAKYANVQPHSGTSANQIVMAAILQNSDKILSLGLNQGGHVSHGAKVSFAGKFFNSEHYYLDPQTFLLDYEAIRQKALQFRPKLIICGASAYSRTIDFKKFREIADEVNAYLMADISHISGLVIAGVHPSPIDYAHFTTTSTYKPGGPRGGLILIGKDFDKTIQTGTKEITLAKLIDKTTFPGVQGTPCLNNIAAKAVFFKETLSDEYIDRQHRIISNAQHFAQIMLEKGYDVLTGGTDNHLFLINITNSLPCLTGVIAQKALEQCGIIVNMNRLPYDTRNAFVTSGIRIGTPIITKNGMNIPQIYIIAELIDSVLREVKIISQTQYELSQTIQGQTFEKVSRLCNDFPMW
jgi:glycine hydroxymethyltransferase